MHSGRSPRAASAGRTCSARHDGVRRGGRAHEDVDVGERAPTLLVVHRDSAVALRELDGALERPVGDDRRPHALPAQALERELRHLARAEDHRARAGERSEDLLRQLHRRRAHRRGAARDRRLGPNATGDRQRRLEEAIEHGSRLRAALFPRIAHLPVDLRFAEHHGIETAGDAEEVARRLAVAAHIARATTRRSRRRDAPTARATQRAPRRRPIPRDRSRCGCRSRGGRSRAPRRPTEAAAAPRRLRSSGRPAAREPRAARRGGSLRRRSAPFGQPRRRSAPTRRARRIRRRRASCSRSTSARGLRAAAGRCEARELTHRRPHSDRRTTGRAGRECAPPRRALGPSSRQR